jgi:hypothetical protein
MQGNPAVIMTNTATPFPSNGTSYATPQLAGWAACLWQANKSSNASAVKMAIIKSAHVYNTPGAQLGYGVPDFYKASEYLKIKDTPEVLSKDNWVTIVPNPIGQKIQMWVYLAGAETVTFNVTDAAGKKILKSEVKLQSGKQPLQLDMPGVASGVYFLSAETPSRKISVRFIKQ